MAATASGSKPTRPESTRRAVEVWIDGALVNAAQSLGIDISEEIESSLTEAVRRESQRRWREESRNAIDACNADLDRNGLWSDGRRLF